MNRRIPWNVAAIARQNLFLVHEPNRFDVKDLAEIGSRVVRSAPGINVHVVNPRDTISFAGPSGKFVPPRGPILENKSLSKVDQYRRMTSASLPMPRTSIFRLGETYDEREWGEFVVLKPADLSMTSKGDNVRLMRTRRLN